MVTPVPGDNPSPVLCTPHAGAAIDPRTLWRRGRHAMARNRRARDRLHAMSELPLSPAAARALLEWQIAMGADEAIGETALDRLAPPPAAPTNPLASPLPPPPLPSPASGGEQGGGAAEEGRLGAATVAP